MSDYNFAGLNPRDFEHLTQSLALKVISTGVTPFGDGPDGGREAIFTGKMDYEATTKNWDGYLVIQCKFKQRSTGNITTDGAWAYEQLESDLKKFIDKKLKLPKPEYYIFVTNVVLTGVNEKGSKDKVFALLKKYKSKIGLKDYDVWDYDKLCRLIDGQLDIRRAFAGFITSGDVLTQVCELLTLESSDFSKIMSLFLQRELRAEQFAKLEQAGLNSDQKTALAKVFVDLPATHEINIYDDESDIFIDDDSENTVSHLDVKPKLKPGIVCELLENGSRILKKSILPTSPELLVIENEEGEAEFEFIKSNSKFVVVGGPGQGKSTVGQFLCQLYRTAILKDQTGNSLETDELIRSIHHQIESNNLTIPTVRRFPVKIVLEQFAFELAQNNVESLIAYIVRRIAKITNHEVSLNCFRKWLANYPWLLVLDGLDEVPSSSNRNELLEKITDFLDEVAADDSDVMVVATTRPQGYNDEFSPKYYSHRFLIPLTPQHALFYASRLTDARYGQDEERKEKIMTRLRAALGVTTVRRLMRSPLQVTIMSTLVESIGHPPEERWRLFNEYYHVIYKRETERDITSSKILRQNSNDVDVIHNRVGLLLQIESESAGLTESRLSSEDFKALVRTRLIDEGYEDNELDKKEEEITTAALDRLVFLVGLESDKIGFEVRSLQEFTAAEALMQGSDSQVQARLEEIAPIIHWRNVFLFAAGKCFAKTEHLRAAVINICDQLNDSENSFIEGITLAGSRLALDILEDGMSRQQPKNARHLARIASRLLELPDQNFPIRLANIYSAFFEEALKNKIEIQMKSEEFESKSSSWAVIQLLMNRDVDWVSKLAEKYWDEESSENQKLFYSIKEIANEWWLYKYQKFVENTPPREILSHSHPNINLLKLGSIVPEWLNFICKYSFAESRKNQTSIYFFTGETKEPLFSVSFVELKNKYIVPIKEMAYNKYWATLISGARFADDCTHFRLANELRCLADIWEKELNFVNWNIPWVLANCLISVETKEDLLRTADLAETGKLGTFEDWSQLENRWKNNGFNIEDLDHTFVEDDTLVSEMASLGIASPLFDFEFQVKNQKTLDALLKCFFESENKITKNFFSFMILKLLSSLEIASRHNDSSNNSGLSIDPKILKEIIEVRKHNFLQFSFGNISSIPEVLDEEWAKLFDYIGQTFEVLAIRNLPESSFNKLFGAYENNSGLKGLIPLMSKIVLSSRSFPFDQKILSTIYDDVDFNDIALLLKFKKFAYDKNSFDTLIPEIFKRCLENQKMLENIISLARRIKITKIQLPLFTNLFEELSKNNRLERFAILDILNSYLGTKPSQLKFQPIRERLGLPHLNVRKTIEHGHSFPNT